MRRSLPKFAFDEWMMALLNNAISPGLRAKSTAAVWSNSASMNCSRESRLLVANASLCGNKGPRCDPGMPRMQPFSVRAGESASATITTMGLTSA